MSNCVIMPPMQLEVKKLASAKAVFRVYWNHTKGYTWLMFFVLLGGVGVQAADLIAPLYLRQFFNTLATHAPNDATAHELVVILLFVALMWLLDRIFRRVSDVSNIVMQSRVMTNLFDSTFEYLMGHSYNFFISNFAGSLTHKVSKFVRSYETLFDTVMVQFFPTTLFVLGAVGVLFVRSRPLGIALGLWCVGFVLFQWYMAKLRAPARSARAEADTRVTGSLADAIGNQGTVSLFSGFAHERSRFKAVVEVWRAATLRNWLFDGWMWFGIGLFIMLIEVGLLWGAIPLWQRGIITLGDFVLIQTYLISIFDRLVGINRDLRRFFDAFADAAEMVYILEQPHGIEDKRGANRLSVSEATIVFDDVSFGFYKDNILNNFNLAIRDGEHIALVGPSGAGKTTVTKLLLRLYDVKKGRVTIDGQNIADVTQDSLRNAIAFVPQEPILFHRTLMENIRYGRREANDEEVLEAAKKAHCHEFIEKLPEKYETFVGERGVKLSGGERQRVAIARALLKNAPILVLDEATSSLDSESESLIQDALANLMQGKTVVVIAHRLSTIMKMDRTVVMQEGGIVAQGTHEELLRQEGLYQKLWSIQAGGFLGGEEEKSDPRQDDDASDEEAVDAYPRDDDASLADEVKEK